MTATPEQGRTTSLNERVAEEIRAIMARRRISGVQLTGLMGRSHTYLWNRLSGKTSFSMDDLEEIAGLLDVPVQAFFARPVLSNSSLGSLREGVTKPSKCTPSMLTATITSRYVTESIDAPLDLAA